MNELSLNILDIANNSTAAGASLVEITLCEKNDFMEITITDNGRGMTKEFAARVTDPFSTSRKTRPVGLGLPFFKAGAEQTGGSFKLESVLGKGTTVYAKFNAASIDCAPLGDICATICTLIGGAPETDFVFSHKTEKGSVNFDTRELRTALGEDISLAESEVIMWIRDNLTEEYNSLKET